MSPREFAQHSFGLPLRRPCPPCVTEALRGAPLFSCLCAGSDATNCIVCIGLSLHGEFLMKKTIFLFAIPVYSGTSFIIKALSSCGPNERVPSAARKAISYQFS